MVIIGQDDDKKNKLLVQGLKNMQKVRIFVEKALFL